MASFALADQYAVLRDRCDYTWREGKRMLELAHWPPHSVDETHLSPELMKRYIAELLLWLQMYCFYEPLTIVGSDSNTCCVWRKWYKDFQDDGTYRWESWVDSEKYVKQEERLATSLNTSHMTLQGFWGASFGEGAFFDSIQQCLAEKPNTTTFVLLIAGNDVDGWTDPEQIAFEMDRLKTFCNERGVRLIYIDVVPAWSQQ